MTTKQIGKSSRNGKVTPEQKFSSYVDMACNMDNLLWANQTTLLGITVLGWGAVALAIEKKISFFPLSNSETISVILIISACLYAITLIAKSRMHFWHKKIENELSKIESEGYFNIRQEPKPWHLSAAKWVIRFYSVLAIIMVLVAIFLLVLEPRERTSMTEIAPDDAARSDGVTTQHSVMENGERRFRLRTADGNGYILTRTTVGGWQQSHRHQHVAETYVVEKGWMIFVAAGLAAGSKPEITRLEPGQTITSPVGRVHNVYLPAGAEIHTVKFGGRNGERDWEAHPEFDEITKTILIDVD